jgi:flavodoxin
VKKILIAYYSLFGTTELAAEYLAKAVNGNLHKILSEKEYSFDYNTAVKEARRDIENGYCPKLTSTIDNIGDYDIVFIGGPNWFRRFPPPIMSFLKIYGDRMHEVVPFCTHGGGGLGDIEKELKGYLPKTIVKAGLSISQNAITEDIDSWINETRETFS